MTSRPEAVNDIRKYFNREIEISGFDSQHVYSYIKQLRSPENETIAATLVKKNNAELMCFTPLHLTMMVRLAYFDIDMVTYLNTETALYTQFLFLTVKQYKPHQLTWTTDSLEECFIDKLSQSELCQLFKIISKLAYDAIKNNKQSFNSTLLPKEYHDKVKNLSLFTIETRPGPSDDNNVFIYYFSHKTFLEFVAACHLYMLRQENQTNAIYWFENVYYNYYEISDLNWKFFFGLLGKYDINSFNTIFKYLSYRRGLCCNITRVPMFSSYNPDISTTSSNLELLEYAYEAELRGDDLAQIVRDRNVIVGPKFNDELRLSLWRPKHCLFMDYALRSLPIRHLVLDFTDAADCGAFNLLNRNKDNYQVEELDLRYMLLFPDVSPLSAAIIKTLLTVLPISRLKYVTLTFGFEIELFNMLSLSLLESLNPENVEKLHIKCFVSLSHVYTGRILKQLQLFPNLVDIRFDGNFNSTGIVSVCDALVGMPQLQVLDLSIDGINATAANVLAEAVSSLYQLRSLTLNVYSIINWELMEHQSGLNNLTLLESLTLNIGDRTTQYNCTDIIVVVFSLRHLKKLKMDIRNCIEVDSSKTNEVIDNWNQSSELEYLTIRYDSRDSQATNMIVKKLQFSPRLKFLEIRTRTNNNSHFLQRLADGFRNLTELQHLSLSHQGLNGSEQLAEGLKNLKSLRYLHLSFTSRIPWSSLSSRLLFTSLSFLPLLVKLDLSNNDLRDIEEMAECLPNLNKLTELTLHESQINDNGLKSLAESLSYLTQLEVLNLGANYFGDDGIMALSETLSLLTKLEYLDLSYNKIGNKGALALVNSLQNATSLVYLNIEKNGITSRGAALKIKESVQHLPNLKPIKLDNTFLFDFD